MTPSSPLITPELISSALTYEAFVQLSADLFEAGRTTAEAPAYNTPEMLGYTKLNLHRMNRLHRLTAIRPDLSALMARVPQPWIWLVLTESWCGDSAQSVPVLHRIARESDRVQMRFLLRDQQPDLMNAYLTNGGRSIPKLICVQPDSPTTFRELGTWGPRPADLQALVMAWRAEKVPSAEISEREQRWYNHDRTESIQREMLALVNGWLNL